MLLTTVRYHELFEKVLDLISHLILFPKFKNLGVHGKTLDLVKSYLPQRAQATLITNSAFSFLPLFSVIGVLEDCLLPIERVRSIPYLGIVIDQDLSWKGNINKVVKLKTTLLYFIQAEDLFCKASLL